MRGITVACSLALYNGIDPSEETGDTTMHGLTLMRVRAMRCPQKENAHIAGYHLLRCCAGARRCTSDCAFCRRYNVDVDVDAYVFVKGRVRPRRIALQENAREITREWGATTTVAAPCYSQPRRAQWRRHRANAMRRIRAGRACQCALPQTKGFPAICACASRGWYPVRAIHTMSLRGPSSPAEPAAWR